MRINTKKTETMCIGNTANFYVDGIKLVNVTHFKYLGSILSSDCSMRAELVSKTSCVMCLWSPSKESFRLTRSHCINQDRCL